MNKVVLGLNALILIVNFVLTFASSETQIDVLQATARAGNSATGQRILGGDPSIPYMRLVQSLEGSIPKERVAALTADQLRTVYDATAQYRASVEQGVLRILARDDGETPILRQHEELSRHARDEVEGTLRAAIRDDFLVRQITTAIISQTG